MTLYFSVYSTFMECKDPKNIRILITQSLFCGCKGNNYFSQSKQ